MEIIPDRDRPNNNVAQSGQKWSEGKKGGGAGRRRVNGESWVARESGTRTSCIVYNHSRALN